MNITNLTFSVESIVADSEFLSMTQNFSWLHRGVAEIFPQPHDHDHETESLEKAITQF